MECHGDLDQPLKKLLVFRWGGAPHVFKSFVGVEEVGLVEQGNASQIRIGLHFVILAYRRGDVASYVSTVSAMRT
jgi:hypothetical protein